MSAPKPAGGLALARLRLTGVVFLLVIAVLLWLSTALYSRKFADVVKVELKTDRIGNQLSVSGDVKVRGLIVGRITHVDADADGATITLAIDRSKAALVPRTSVGRLLPKTLFGEKFVSLVPGAAAPGVRKGDVLQQDRSVTAIETAKVLDDLLPLLKALDPDDLSSTLNAVSGALRGRGDEIGDNLVRLRDYLVKLNPSLPTIRQDLEGLADLADELDDTTPDLLRVLDNLSFSSRSLQDQSEELTRFLSTTTTFAGSADTLLRQNEQRVITVARESLPGLQLLAHYAPAYGCFLKGLDRYRRIVGASFGGAQPGLRITLEVTADNGGFAADDKPEYLDRGAPGCRGLPASTTVPAPDEEFKDGYQDAERVGINGAVSTRGAVDPQVLSDEQVLKGLGGAVLGTSADDVPDLAALLLGPIARGATVGLAP